MSSMNEPIENDLSLPWYYAVLLFSIIILWAVLSIEILFMLFGILVSDSTSWLSVSVPLLLIYPLPLAATIWRMKWSLEITEPEWEFKDQYISFSEFRTISKDYRSNYTLFTSRFALERVVLVAMVLVFSMSLPFILDSLLFPILVFLPQLFGLLTILLGILYTSLFFAIIPGPLNHEFPLYPHKPIRRGLRLLSDIPALSWIGVCVRIGYWSGYYTIREPLLAAKIEGLESVATLLCSVTQDGAISYAWVHNEMEHEGFPKIPKKARPTSDDIIDMVREVVKWYSLVSPENEVLDDVMFDLGIGSSE